MCLLTKCFAYPILKLNNDVMYKEFVEYAIIDMTIDGKVESKKNIMTLL